MLFVCLVMVVCSGCNDIGFIADKLGPGDIDAKFVPPKWPMVVIAENYHAPSGNLIDSEQLAELVYDHLRKHDVAPQIDPDAVMELKARRIDFDKMTISQIGKTVGAQQVLYINITESSLTGPVASNSLAGKWTARVKMVDVDTGQATWPRDQADGWPILVKTPLLEAAGASDEVVLRRALQEKAADAIAKLFYKSASEELGQ